MKDSIMSTWAGQALKSVNDSNEHQLGCARAEMPMNSSIMSISLAGKRLKPPKTTASSPQVRKHHEHQLVWAKIEVPIWTAS